MEFRWVGFSNIERIVLSRDREIRGEIASIVDRVNTSPVEPSFLHLFQCVAWLQEESVGNEFPNNLGGGWIKDKFWQSHGIKVLGNNLQFAQCHFKVIP
jgi:hypothetical protein